MNAVWILNVVTTTTCRHGKTEWWGQDNGLADLQEKIDKVAGGLHMAAALGVVPAAMEDGPCKKRYYTPPV